MSFIIRLSISMCILYFSRDQDQDQGHCFILPVIMILLANFYIPYKFLGATFGTSFQSEFYMCNYMYVILYNIQEFRIHIIKNTIEIIILFL